MAAADGRRYIQNATNRVYGVIKLVTSGNPLGSALGTPDAEISKDGGAFADCSDEAHDIGTTGYFYVDLTATECTASHVHFVQKCADANAVYYTEQIRFEPASDSGVAQAGTSTTIQLRAAASATNDTYNGQEVEIVRGTGAGQRRRVVDYVGATTTATVDRIWATNPDNTSVYRVGDGIGGSLTDGGGGLLWAQADLFTIGGDYTNYSTIYTGLALFSRGIKGAALSGSPTTTVFVTDLSSSTDNYYRYDSVTFVSGNLRGITRQVTGYNGATKAITVYPELPEAPGGSDTVFLTGLFV